jgi:hypothetical protein
MLLTMAIFLQLCYYLAEVWSRLHMLFKNLGDRFLLEVKTVILDSIWLHKFDQSCSSKKI